MIEYQACPICASERLKPGALYNITRHKRWASWMPSAILWKGCADCGHEFTSHHWEPDELARLCEADVPMATSAQELNGHRTASLAIVGAVKRIAPALGDWLDVGFGDGMLMSAVNELGGRAEGVELSERLLARARAHGLTVSREPQRGGYDVVSAMDVLEHAPHPETTLRELVGLLRQDGALVLSTPRRDCLAWQVATETPGGNPYYAELEHHHNFTFGTVEYLLRQVGFKVMHVGPSPRYLFGMLVVGLR